MKTSFVCAMVFCLAAVSVNAESISVQTLSARSKDPIDLIETFPERDTLDIPQDFVIDRGASDRALQAAIGGRAEKKFVVLETTGQSTTMYIVNKDGRHVAIAPNSFRIVTSEDQDEVQRDIQGETRRAAMAGGVAFIGTWVASGFACGASAGAACVFLISNVAGGGAGLAAGAATFTAFNAGAVDKTYALRIIAFHNNHSYRVKNGEQRPGVSRTSTARTVAACDLQGGILSGTEQHNYDGLPSCEDVVNKTKEILRSL